MVELHRPARRAASPMPPTRLYLPPLPEDEADLFNAGEPGHEGIERDALAGVDAGRRAAIYFGNWQRDLSQVMAPVFHKHLGGRTPLLCGLLFDVVDVMAEARFGRRLDQARFGTYRWEEHLDNPREYGIALDPATYLPIPSGRRRSEDAPEAGGSLAFWQEAPDGLPNYLHAARNYVIGQLAQALRHGPHDLGLEHFGNAMHTVEDLYAHSNFIELGLLQLGVRVDPKTGHDKDSGDPLRDGRRRFRLTTGIFQLSDTLVSVQKLLLLRLEGPHPGQPPSNMNKKILRVLIRRRLGDTALATYDRLMGAWEATRIPALVERITRPLDELIMRPLHHSVAELLRPLTVAAARQTGRDAFLAPDGRKIVEISHSLVAKDDPHHLYHPQARQLAIIAVRDFWRALEGAWGRPGASANAGALFGPLLARYMNHPQAAGDWWEAPLGGRRGGGTAPPTPPPTPRPPTPPKPRPPAPPGGARPLLGRGARGPAVRDLQVRLNAWGARAGRAPLAMDGVFGAGTDAAVRDYQRASGLAADGLVGPQTWGALAAALTAAHDEKGTQMDRLTSLFAAPFAGPRAAPRAWPAAEAVLPIFGPPRHGDSMLVNRWVAANTCKVQRSGGGLYARPDAAITHVVIHVLEGYYANAIESWRTGRNCYKGHYVISKEGEITQVVLERHIAPHANRANGYSVGIEHDGFGKTPATFTEPMYLASAALTRDICRRYKIPVDREHIIGHDEAPGTTHGDPGGYWDWEYYLALVRWDGDLRTRPLRVVLDARSSVRRGAGWEFADRAAVRHTPFPQHSYGAKYLRARGGPTAHDPAVFSTGVPADGTYEIAAWWPVLQGNNPATALAIFAGGATAPVLAARVDQRTRQGRVRRTLALPNTPIWCPLGTVRLRAGDTVRIEVSRRSDSPGWVVADTFRLLRR